MHVKYPQQQFDELFLKLLSKDFPIQFRKRKLIEKSLEQIRTRYSRQMKYISLNLDTSTHNVDLSAAPLSCDNASKMPRVTVSRPNPES